MRTRNVPTAECAELERKGAAAGRLRAGRGRRQWRRHSAGAEGEDFRALLHHQGSRQGHGPRPLDGLRHRQAVRRFRLRRSEVGKGTTFRILLPRYIPDEASDVAVKVEAAKPTADYTGQGVILLVEDEDAVRAFGARALEVARLHRSGGRPSGWRRSKWWSGSGARSTSSSRTWSCPRWTGRPCSGAAQARRKGEGDFRLRLRGGGLRQEPSRRRVRLSAKALHAQAIDRDGEAEFGVGARECRGS